MAVRPIDGNDFVRKLTLDTSKGHYGEFMDGSEVAFTFREIAAFVEQMPTLTPPNEWVSVEERLPEHMKDVIVLYGGGKIDIDWVDSLGDFMFDNLFGRVTHWMPLPAPPEKE